MARAKPTRFCMPPDSSEGIFPPTPGNSTNPSTSFHASIDLRNFGHTRAPQRKCNIIVNIHRVKQRRTLEKHAEFLPNAKQLTLTHAHQILTINTHRTFIRRKQAN